MNILGKGLRGFWSELEYKTTFLIPEGLYSEMVASTLDEIHTAGDSNNRRSGLSKHNIRESKESRYHHSQSITWQQIYSKLSHHILLRAQLF